jgi:hypothetical protein
VVIQATHRVFGSNHPDRVRAVLDYHGLDSRHADQLASLASRHGVSVRTMTGRIHQLRAAITDVELPPQIVAAVTRASTPNDDHLGRVRIATTLHLAAPASGKPLPLAAPSVSASHLAAGRAGIRLLATIGPLDIDAIVAAIGRCRRFRVRDPLTAKDLVAALDSLGATRGNDMLWHSPSGAEVPARYRCIVEAAAGFDLTRQQMIDVLIAAGYTPSSATGRMSSSHPLFERIDHDRYRIIGSPCAPSYIAGGLRSRSATVPGSTEPPDRRSARPGQPQAGGWLDAGWSVGNWLPRREPRAPSVVSH